MMVRDHADLLAPQPADLIDGGRRREEAQQQLGFYEVGSYHQYNNSNYYVQEDVRSIKIACGCYHTLLVSQDGHLYTFGRGNHGQLGHGNVEDQKMPRQVPNLTDKPIKISG